MKNTFFIFATFCCISLVSVAQKAAVVSGIVVHGATGAGLAGAIVKQNRYENQTITDETGHFALTIGKGSDSIFISHVGFKTSAICLKEFASESKIMLEEYASELKAVTVHSRSFSFKEIEKGIRLVKDNLYAYNTETTNALYNLFLSDLERTEATDALRVSAYDLSSYDSEEKARLKRYSEPVKAPRKKNDTAEQDFSNFPAVNISHAGAVLFCEWLTHQYNMSPGKRKFKKVKFRLPTRNEWQVAALGYPKFQAWNLEENFVEVVIPSDTVSGMLIKGSKSKVSVTKDNVWYPWYNAYNYRKKPYNHLGCYLGNFKVDGSRPVCGNIIRPGGDGWTMMSETASYYPNDMGLFDVVGNVAEMIAEDFVACGGSWNETPEMSTIHSIKTYTRPSDTIGFRFFMEVLEK